MEKLESDCTLVRDEATSGREREESIDAKSARASTVHTCVYIFNVTIKLFFGFGYTLVSKYTYVIKTQLRPI